MSGEISSLAYDAWLSDADRLDPSRIPDAQVPIIGLVAAYKLSGEPKTVKSWSNRILANQDLRSALSALLPEAAREDLMDDEQFEFLPYSSGITMPTLIKMENFAIKEALPDGETRISASRHFLVRQLAHAAYNFTVKIAPLDIELSYARQPLRDFFPKTLVMYEDAV